MPAISSPAPTPATDAVVILRGATVTRPGAAVVLDGVEWTIREGETWAVIGPVGSGKTTLAEAILGRHPLAAGTVEWQLLDRLRAAGRHVAFPADVTRLVSFREESRLFSYRQHYYQERFDFADADNNLTLEAFLAAGSPAGPDDARGAARALGVADLLPVTFIKLSNGQVRRARIARAVLARPELLILDDPFMGLDAAGRGELTALLGGLIRGGLRVVVVTRPGAVPDWVTHVIELRDGRVTRQGPNVGWAESSRPTRGMTPPRVGLEDSAHPTEPVIEFDRVTVRYTGRPVLHDVTWTVRRGERWAVLGPNGAGKTTLLSLVCGDHPQAYSNAVRVFGRRRGTGESIWEVKANVGLVSPELHLYFTAPLTAAEAASTGFFDVVTPRPTTAEQAETVRHFFREFGVCDLAGRPFGSLSTGQQRLVLLVRALVKRPPLLVLDEPFQGLDGEAVARARGWLDARLGPDQTLLFVTHDEAEIPASVTRRLRLRGGEVVAVEGPAAYTPGA